mgnify:CR=1 FL=1
MKIGEAISKRRSIRRYKPEPIPNELIEQVLEAATLAPSGKNAQPWEFIILEGEDKDNIAEFMTKSAEQPEVKGFSTRTAENSAKVILRAQVVIMVYNSRQKRADEVTPLRKSVWSMDIQSVGAAIQNMLLKAVELGLGSLWICDVFVAEEQISNWLGRTDELVATVALGWPDEEPAPRPRKSWQQLTHWGRNS